VKIVLVEGDGGNGAYSTRDTFDGNGITATAGRYGMSTAVLSETPWEWRETAVGGRTVRLPYSPFFARREYDRFVSAPLFKNHIYTYVTLGMKNLWGCIPDAYRIFYHHVLDHGIVALMKELRPDFSIFDGLVATRGRGPIDGQPLDMNAVMTCSDVGAGEAAALHVMGVPLSKVRHLRIAAREGLMPGPDRVEWRSDPTPFVRDDFVVTRSVLNHLTVNLARSPRMQRLVYHSRLSSAIYAVVNRIRGESPQTKLSRDKQAGRFHNVPLDGRRTPPGSE
jgi:uncharacterized protein (DUF362 family)